MVNQQALTLPPAGSFISNSLSLVCSKQIRQVVRPVYTCISQHVKSQPGFSVKISFYQILNKCLGPVWFKKNVFKARLV